jgi:hypothetical protein
MSRKTILVTVLSLTLIVAGYGLVQAHGGRNGGGYGQGMMGYGYGGGGDCGGPRNGDCDARGGRGWRGGDKASFNANITMDEAKGLVEARVSRNPYLKVGKVTENENGFEVQVVTKEGEQLVNRLQVEKDTGRVYRVFE